MTDDVNVDDLELTDAELLTLLKRHGLDRRTLMRVLGLGAGATALGGTATAGKGGGNRIDEIYGATYAADHDTVPSGLVDHTIDLHIHHGDATHEGFPVGDDVRDTDPEQDGFQGDDDDQDDLPETFFDPVGLHVTPGEVVEFTVHGTGLHTVTSFDPKFNEPPFLSLPDRVPTDHAFTSPPVAEDDSWLYRFTTKGVYDIFCLPHVSLGMVVRIVVFDPDEDSIDDSTFDEWGPLKIPRAKAVLSDDALNPKNIVGVGKVAWADLSLP